MLLCKMGPPGAFFAVVLAVTLIATWEYYGMATGLGHRPFVAAGLVAAAGISCAFFFEAVPLMTALAIASVLTLLLALARADLSQRAFTDISATFTGAVLPATLLGFLLQIRLLEEERGLRGDLVLLLLAAIWVSDAGAYYIGSWLGRHKMAPRVSPKKTWEGAAGGVIGALVGCFVYRTFLWRGATQLEIVDALAVSFIVALVGPCGDLAESVLKRSASVKDSSQLIPGHGGVLDRVDSLLFAAPVLYYYYRLFI